MVVDMLHNLLIMIRCTRNTHKNCKPVRNALLDNFKNVLHAYTTNSEIDGVYCVVYDARLIIIDTMMPLITCIY